MKRLLVGLAAAAAVAIAPAATAGAQDAATITLLHGIPGATVDVAVGGQVLLPGFEPGATQDLSAFAGQTLADLEVFAAGTEDVVISIPELTVPASGNWTVMAHLDAEGTPTVTPFENNTAPTAAGEGRLTVRHTAAAPAVDLVVGDTRPIEGAENGASAELALPAGEIAGAQIAPAGGDPLLDVPTVNLAEGTNLIVYAVGSLADGTLDFLTQEIEVGTDGGTDDAGDEGDAGDDETADDEGDGTAEPTQVATGTPIEDGNTAWAYGFALAAVALAAGAFMIRRRETAKVSVDS